MGKVQSIIAERIVALCKERNLKPYGLATESGVPLSTICHLLDGTTKNPGILTIAKVCNGLEITLEEFFATADFQELLVVVSEEE